MFHHSGVLPGALRSAVRLNAPSHLQEGSSGGLTEGRSADLQPRPNDEARLPGERIFSHGSCPQADGDCNGECPQATEIAMASVDMHACNEGSINTNFMRGTEVTFFAERSKARAAKLLPCDRFP